MRVLVVEDDKNVRSFLKTGLTREGFAVDLVSNGQEALASARETAYDVILLDIMMPELDGLSVLRRLRAEGHNAAILMVTCQGQEQDKLAGLEAGADDYLVKPFLLTELTARIRAVLRRIGRGTASGSTVVLTAGPLRLDLVKHRAEWKGRAIPLTKKEYELLEYFLRHPGRVVSQSVIAQHVWNIDHDTRSNVVEAHLRNLRVKIAKAGGSGLIETVRGFGYRLRE